MINRRLVLLRFKVFLVVCMLSVCVPAWGKCVNGVTYALKGYMEDVNNIPQTGKTLTEVKFDIFYDDGTSSIGNNATAEMGQGWYRYSYASNGKSGIWVMRDSTGTYKNFPGGILETLCDSQVHTALVNSVWDEAKAGHITAGTFGDYLDSKVSLAGGGGSSDWTTAEKANIRYRLGVDGTATAPVTNTTNLGDVGITQVGADKVWGTTSRTITGGTVTTNNDKTGYTANVVDKTGFSLATNQSGVTIGTVNTVANGVTVATNNDKSGYALSAAGVDSIWDEAQAGHATAGTFGKYLDAQVSLISGGGGSSDWTATEKENIRYRLGVDGTATAPVANTPNLGDVGITQVGADKVWGTTSRTITGGTVTTNTDKTGYALSTAGVDAILDDTVEGSLTMRQMVRIMASALAGKAAGGGTTTITFTGLDGTTTRITATVDANGNRSAVTVNGN